MKTFFWIGVTVITLGFGKIESAMADQAPVRVAIYGLTHDHVKGFLPDILKRPDVQLVGIVDALA